MRLVGMKNTLHLVPVAEPSQDNEELADSTTIAATETRQEVADIQAIADALDQVRRICGDLGPATLLAECHGAPREMICAALQEIVQAGLRSLTTLHEL
jgi:hypothetical protein